jgi:hypothetical protein
VKRSPSQFLALIRQLPASCTRSQPSGNLENGSRRDQRATFQLGQTGEPDQAGPGDGDDTNDEDLLHGKKSKDSVEEKNFNSFKLLTPTKRRFAHHHWLYLAVIISSHGCVNPIWGVLKPVGL